MRPHPMAHHLKTEGLVGTRTRFGSFTLGTEFLCLGTAWLLGLGLVSPAGSYLLPLSAQSNSEAQIQRHYQAAREAEKCGDLDKAATEYLAVLELRPGEPIILNNLGLVYHLQGKYRKAIETLQQAVQRNPELVGAQLFLGID